VRRRREPLVPHAREPARGAHGDGAERERSALRIERERGARGGGGALKCGRLLGRRGGRDDFDGRDAGRARGVCGDGGDNAEEAGAFEGGGGGGVSVKKRGLP
jgi:hypothetical protein